MKPTSDKVFLDTNIIVYAHTNLEPGKQKTAQQIIEEQQTVISTQVLQETAIRWLENSNTHGWMLQQWLQKLFRTTFST
jgi:predicted nucleic acid-binding protein